MPELPDLQVFSKNLCKRLNGKTLKKIYVPYPKRLNVPANEFKKRLEGKKLTDIRRVGKELYFEFGSENILSLHMMLHGELYMFEKKNDHKNTIIELLFDDGTGLALTDFQKKATPTLNPKEKEAPDALSKEVSFSLLKKLLQSKATIKNLLMDQHVIRGIGNAYADEILWDSRISPLSVSNKIPDNKVKDLTRSIKRVLKDAEKQILKEHPDIIGGEVRDFLKVHNAKKKESPTGGKIIQKQVGGRRTYYTEEQEEYF
jgi:formamidopyrimidine-DNA glycosylase